LYALKIRINNEEPIIAGADDLCVLTAGVNCVGRLGDKSCHAREDEGADLFVSVGGLTSRAPELADEHLNWLSQRPLQIGDIVCVEILDTPSADAPIGGEEAEKSKQDEREYYEHCKRTYFELREKYEPTIDQS
jgi:hypothetical protein